MSLNTTTSFIALDEIQDINLDLSGGLTHYTPGQTISYSLLTTGVANQTIFNGYKAQYHVDVSFDGGIWTSNTQWGENVDTSIRAAAEVINLNFSLTADVANSDLRWTAVDDNTNSSVIGYSYLVPSFDMDGQGDGDDAGILIYTASPFHVGSTAFSELGGGNERTMTMIHELGHFLGLQHPHTNQPGDAPFPELNDFKYDIMSYNYSEDGRRYDETPNGSGGVIYSSTYSFGGFLNFTPINIAALQHAYGANNSNHTTATTYTLTDAQSAAVDIDGSDGTISVGRAYYTIWDTGDIDEIVYSGVNRVLLNLNAATLSRNTNNIDLVETLDRVSDSNYYGELYNGFKTGITNSLYYAGGFFSQILTDDNGTGGNFDGKYANTLGGFAIANGVQIENATGGSANDLLIGNEYNNTLTGNGGNDTIFDGNGNDIIFGNAGDDIFYVGKGNDVFHGGANNDTADIYSLYTRFMISKVGNQITVTDIIDQKYGTNIFNDVEQFVFEGQIFNFANLVEGNFYELEFADLLNNDFISDLGLGQSNTINDIFWGTNVANQFFGSLSNDLFNGKNGTDSIIISENLADYGFTINSQSQLIITSLADATLYDVLHSIETISFDSGDFDIATLDAIDLGISAGDFSTWQTGYDYG